MAFLFACACAFTCTAVAMPTPFPLRPAGTHTIAMAKSFIMMSTAALLGMATAQWGSGSGSGIPPWYYYDDDYYTSYCSDWCAYKCRPTILVWNDTSWAGQVQCGESPTGNTATDGVDVIGNLAKEVMHRITLATTTNLTVTTCGSTYDTWLR